MSNLILGAALVLLVLVAFAFTASWVVLFLAMSAIVPLIILIKKLGKSGGNK